ncbi:hypothetical protein CUC15_14680 [Oceanobacillus zhaokaii]|uniref:Uncharacterized protein n=1 Tax=Oceanobacillus zhaokaii TaxID=2052660 RepID=A0A345PJB8_9BACI|nr:hypothetical protein [Oceanobacillus zhaokaii]AXI10098.1 hypothetical protein CUC15_14680 [Oceanobacillus zhaokaii]
MDGIYTDLFFYGNFLLAAILYYYLYRIRKLIGFQLGMNIAMVIGGMIAVASGILLISQYPFHYTEITIVSTLIGMIVGGAFGAMFDYQTFLTGFTNGLMIGIMAPMIGAVIDNNSTFILFIEFLFGASVVLVIISRKSS